MRRAMSPATCTQVTSLPSGVRSHSALRSFSSDALSRAALTKAPGKYQRSFTTQSTGERFECTSNTFMNTLSLRASRSEEHTSELQSLAYLVCRLLLEKKKKIKQANRALSSST